MASNDETDINQIDETQLDDIGRSLIELAERLRGAGMQLKGRSLLDTRATYVRDDQSELTDVEIDNENARTRAAFTDTLTALRHFRRDYERWERLTAEFALTRMGYSQRDAARALGAAASTINRWAQNPLKVPDHS